MRPGFAGVTGVMAVMPLANVNTDAIIPSAWLRTARADFGKGLFGSQRYGADGRERPEFVLNRAPFRHAKILLADENFGCGSSREAAVWALAQFGIRCVLAPSFADIFYENAFRNGLLVAKIDAASYLALAAAVDRHGQDPIFIVDLPAGTVTGPDGARFPFAVPAARAAALIRGDDEIDMTLHHAGDIEAYHAAAAATHPWLYAGTDTAEIAP
ncbi:MAG TPA: 3-isopropylmalate dehydratase small subunit [Aliidongia sp.]|uniref:3-isopropylmalate dehydratase small subunit n=1 Tax=Aliidongia sp. TaxID=1914230 RepID=UPI002DDD5A29|nr:3-isopropylmalate dehydratase small subunit [Aliidongia sp.]HEV2676742.1 3-isopropylmalate dehydratase small subunit [Aliidongia sp.]